jgi:hypothetical protein
MDTPERSADCSGGNRLPQVQILAALMDCNVNVDGASTNIDIEAVRTIFDMGRTFWTRPKG